MVEFGDVLSGVFKLRMFKLECSSWRGFELYGLSIDGLSGVFKWRDGRTCKFQIQK